MEPKCTAFVADLHLNEAQPEVFALWQRFLREQIKLKNIEAIYLLGDFFALWAGDDDLSPFNLKVAAVIKNIISQGVKVYLLPGNRDFMLGKQFAALSNCVLLADPTPIDLYNIPTVLTHGDMLCTGDIAMNIFRTITRLKISKKLFLLLPLAVRRKMAELIHEISTDSRKRAGESKSKGYEQNIHKISEQMVQKLLRKYQAQQLIHGHIHYAGIFPIASTTANGQEHITTTATITEAITESSSGGNHHLLLKPKLRFMLGEWTKYRGSVLFYYESGEYELKNFQAVRRTAAAAKARKSSR